MTPIEILELDVSLSKKLDLVYEQIDFCIEPDKIYGIALTIPDSDITRLESNYQFIIRNIEKISSYHGWKAIIIGYITCGCSKKDKIGNYTELYEVFRSAILKLGYDNKYFEQMMAGLEPA